MTGNNMFAIMKQKHKEIAVKEAKTKKKEECVKTALLKLKQDRQAKEKKIKNGYSSAYQLKVAKMSFGCGKKIKYFEFG